ncbi:universal stress protein [Lentzea sp. NPDC004782]|uniref:universal stress protein n=1 Tax=Lentzea sp. NPDC004782 TaxID=3154458 RepID=UPI0033A26DFB
MSDNESRPVVVGVDGSAAARAALEWAVQDARRRGCRVDAVHAYYEYYGGIVGPLPAEVWRELSPQALKAAHEGVLAEAVKRVEDASGVEIRQVLVEGDARTVLAKASEDAELLVVGSRGHGPVAGILLGSVSSYCVHHASCPVVVIREPRIEREEDAAEAVPLTPGPLL